MQLVEHVCMKTLWGNASKVCLEKNTSGCDTPRRTHTNCVQGYICIAHKLRPRNMCHVEEKAGNRNIEYFTGVIFQWWGYIVFLFYIIAHFSNFSSMKMYSFYNT